MQPTVANLIRFRREHLRIEEAADRELLLLRVKHTHPSLASSLGVTRQAVDKQVKAARRRLADSDPAFVAKTDKATAAHRKRTRRRAIRPLVAANTGVHVEEQSGQRQLAAAANATPPPDTWEVAEIRSPYLPYRPIGASPDSDDWNVDPQDDT